MGWIKELKEALKKYGQIGILGQLAIAFAALAALYYRRPTVPPFARYGPTSSFDPVPALQGALPGSHLTADSMVSLAILAVCSLVALWAVFGWAFQGGIWYLKSINKK